MLKCGERRQEVPTANWPVTAVYNRKERLDPARLVPAPACGARGAGPDRRDRLSGWHDEKSIARRMAVSAISSGDPSRSGGLPATTSDIKAAGELAEAATRFERLVAVSGYDASHFRSILR